METQLISRLFKISSNAIFIDCQILGGRILEKRRDDKLGHSNFALTNITTAVFSSYHLKFMNLHSMYYQTVWADFCECNITLIIIYDYNM